ncbi:MAG: CinA family nicotinamide mononucleotide deamidase-related protein [Chloroflexota bacterium]|nr:CinA family nicotinamide mononucleotide deamidase-related protein [Chloroflexota bacterium]
MAEQLNAEIVAIGTEILLGEITDTNSVYLARALRDLGINLYFMTSVGDNEARIEAAIRLALSRAQIVITCGGLGPTVDDMTRQGVAQATDRTLTFHQSLLDAIAARFSGFRVQMTENNRRQAYVPDRAVIIENAVGTAPAFAVEQDDRVVISLPGVPREMKYLWVEKVVPYLRERYSIITTIIKARNFKTAGIGESTLDDMLGDELLHASNPTIGLAAHAGVIDIRITAKADTSEQADAMIADFETKVKARVGEYIFGADADTIEGALLEVLKARGLTLAVIEAGVASIVGERLKGADTGIVKALHMFDDLAGAAAFNIEPDSTIRQIAERLAAAVAEQAGADVGLAIVSLSDTEDDRADAEELSATAVVYGDKRRSRSYGLGGKSETARVWTGTWAMAQVWRMLREE